MQAIEFETYIRGGLIQIPPLYKHLDNLKAKVIILFPMEVYNSNFDKEKLRNAFKNAHTRKVFKSITESVTWQKQIRDEWE